MALIDETGMYSIDRLINNNIDKIYKLDKTSLIHSSITAMIMRTIKDHGDNQSWEKMR